MLFFGTRDYKIILIGKHKSKTSHGFYQGLPPTYAKVYNICYMNNWKTLRHLHEVCQYINMHNVLEVVNHFGGTENICTRIFTVCNSDFTKAEEKPQNEKN